MSELFPAKTVSRFRVCFRLRNTLIKDVLFLHTFEKQAYLQSAIILNHHGMYSMVRMPDWRGPGSLTATNAYRAPSTCKEGRSYVFRKDHGWF